MLRLDIGLTYDEYLDMASYDEREIIEKLYIQGVLEEKDLYEIERIQEPVNILVFSEPACKDAATTIPFLIKLAEFNDKINVKFVRRTGNEEVLARESGEEKVPTFLILNNIGEVERKYIEFPMEVKEILENTDREKIQEVVDDMRLGKYNSLIQKDLIKFITGKEYEFVRYDRKDRI